MKSAAASAFFFKLRDSLADSAPLLITLFPLPVLLQMALLDGDPYPSRKRQQQQQQQKRRKSKREKAFKVRVLVLLFIFFALYVGMEVTYGGFILTYAVKGPPQMDKVSETKACVIYE